MRSQPSMVARGPAGGVACETQTSLTASAVAPATSFTLWLIDDNEPLRQSFADYFDRLERGVRLDCFTNAEEALQAAGSQDRDRPEVIFLDIFLPGMDGVQALPFLRKSFPQAKIVMLTVCEDDRHANDALSRGAHGYLVKPVSAERLLEAAREVLSGMVLISSSVAQRVLRLRLLETSHTRYGLTPREEEALRHLVHGLKKPAIAHKMELSVNSVKTYLRYAFEKLDVHSEIAAVAKVLREHLL